MTTLLLDSPVVSRLCHPARPENRPVADWLESVLLEHSASVVLDLVEIVDYEVRRGLLHVALRSERSTTGSLLRLDRPAARERSPLGRLVTASEVAGVSRPEGLMVAPASSGA